ncbi:hypothetical protein D3C73_1581290 [compost metagenome]
MVAIDGSDRGSMILKNTPKSVHPSILADSSRASGKDWKKFRIMIRLNALIAVGIIMDQ